MLSYYERFAAAVALVLTVLIGVIILVIAVSYWLLRERDDRLPPA